MPIIIILIQFSMVVSKWNPADETTYGCPQGIHSENCWVSLCADLVFRTTEIWDLSVKQSKTSTALLYFSTEHFGNLIKFIACFGSRFSTSEFLLVNWDRFKKINLAVETNSLLTSFKPEYYELIRRTWNGMMFQLIKQLTMHLNDWYLSPTVSVFVEFV